MGFRCGVEYTMKHLVVLLSLLFALVSANHLSCLNSEDVTCPQERIYNGCFCFTEWNDDNRVGNWTLKENWLQLFEPSWVSFVSIAGDNTVTVDEERRVNELYVGPNRWDTTRLVIFEDLTIVYDDVPEISRVSAYRLTNGQTRLAIQGKGFVLFQRILLLLQESFGKMMMTLMSKIWIQLFMTANMLLLDTVMLKSSVTFLLST